MNSCGGNAKGVSSFFQFFIYFLRNSAGISTTMFRRNASCAARRTSFAAGKHHARSAHHFKPAGISTTMFRRNASCATRRTSFAAGKHHARSAHHLKSRRDFHHNPAQPDFTCEANFTCRRQRPLPRRASPHKARSSFKRLQNVAIFWRFFVFFGFTSANASAII